MSVIYFWWPANFWPGESS